MIGRMEKEWIYREKTRRKRFKKSRIYFTEKEEVSVKTVIKICHDTRKTSRVFYKRGAGRTQETVK